MRARYVRCLGVAWLAVTLSGGTALATAQTAGELETARTWIGRAEEVEAFMRTARVVSIVDIGVGVTNPKRAVLEPGGPIGEIAFKPLRPGIYQGHWESYRSEIAAYELDKFLGLGLIPPTVEKRVQGDLGAASMWVSPVESFRDLGGLPTPPSTAIGRFNWELIRAKMFHNLIYNPDPNLGNWLVDPAWNLILIDNSRAFTAGHEMVHDLTRIDRDLWACFLALDESMLTSVLGHWLEDRPIRAILERRDIMMEDVQRMVETRGESEVFVTFMPVSVSAAGTAEQPGAEVQPAHRCSQ